MHQGGPPVLAVQGVWELYGVAVLDPSGPLGPVVRGARSLVVHCGRRPHLGEGRG